MPVDLAFLRLTERYTPANTGLYRVELRGLEPLTPTLPDK
jgi:hypothetical protein